ncbi:MAG: flagellar motor switch protein FliG [Candidatus Hydrogenedentota bacterium]|nr:MAG: flagellar motor switch protein FliG [Candidatus Hydrogenedentota bacterium]
MSDSFNLEEMPGRQKAAIFLACMGSERASRILTTMSENEVEDLTLSLSNLDIIESDVRNSIIYAFYELALENKVVTQGGLDYARGLLEKTFGADKTIEILTRLQSSLQDVPFEFLNKADPGQIVTFIQDEHPQTISLILSHLPAQTSAMVLSALAPEIQSDVTMRIATMERTPPEIVREVERVLERKMASVFTHGFTFAGGVNDVAEILNSIDRAAEKFIMGQLEERDPELADEISRLMFTFDDVVFVEDSGIQKALREVDSKDLALALKGSNDDVRDKVLKNMSERAREMIMEEIEFMGPVRMKNVEEAQQKIVTVIRTLEEAGELIIEGRGSGGDDEIVV